MNSLPLVLLISAVIDIGVAVAGYYGWWRYNSATALLVLIGAIFALFTTLQSFHGRFVSPGNALLISLSLLPLWSWSWWIIFREKQWYWKAILSASLLVVGIFGFAVLRLDLSLPIRMWPISYFVFLTTFCGIGVALIIFGY